MPKSADYYVMGAKYTMIILSHSPERQSGDGNIDVLEILSPLK